MLPSDWVVLGVLAAAGAYYALVRAAARARARGRGAGGRREGAADLLRQQGYAIVDARPEVELAIRVDGRARTRRVRADLLATRGRRRYAVRIRGHGGSGRVDDRATRARLLDYALAFRVDGLLVVDPERQRVRTLEVRAGPLPPLARLAGVTPLLLAFASGLVAAYLLVRGAATGG